MIGLLVVDRRDSESLVADNCRGSIGLSWGRVASRELHTRVWSRGLS
jgi:hypothetical protein